jgi:hypothetical protein
VHTAEWSGAEMIVWGGYTQLFGYQNTGSRYDTSTNEWVATSGGTNLPPPRGQHTAVWTGTEMIVWGGYPITASGGRYCVCSSSQTLYRDRDGDGYGDAASTMEACAGASPAGWAANDTYCNDASAATNPGATEICDGVDNDCDEVTDNAPAPTGIASLAVSQPAPGTARLGWTYGGGDPTGFDIVRGDLATLGGTGGDFAAATETCLEDDTTNPTVDDADTLSPGAGSWYLLRAMNCGGNGSYDTGAPAQSGSRDAEIAASGNDCD